MDNPLQFGAGSNLTRRTLRLQLQLSLNKAPALALKKKMDLKISSLSSETKIGAKKIAQLLKIKSMVRVLKNFS